MSGAQPKAAEIAGLISVIAEVNPKAVKIRYDQGWVNEVYSDMNKLVSRVIKARKNKEPVFIGLPGEYS